MIESVLNCGCMFRIEGNLIKFTHACPDCAWALRLHRPGSVHELDVDLSELPLEKE